MKSYTFVSSTALTFIFLGILGACTTPPPPSAPVEPVTRLAAQIEGTYYRSPSDTAEPLRDRRIRLSPLGPGEWIYYQVNEGEDLEKVYRQRVLHLQAREDGALLQVAYTLKAPETYQALDAPLDQLTLDDLDSTFEQGCEMIWVEMADGWAGRVDPQTCVIFSKRRDMEIRIGSRADLIGNRLRQGESGYDVDGDRLWGSKDGEWLTLYRSAD